MPTAIICDIDGTLALRKDRGPYNFELCRDDELSPAVYDILARYATTETHILLVSSREDKYREKTEEWLFWHKVPYATLFMRPTKDTRNDSVVKKEIYETQIKNKYQILFVLDDRNRVVEMWRSEGLTCLQVADGNF